MRSVNILLSLLLGECLPLFLPENKELVQGSSVEEAVAGHPVHLGLFGVEVVQESGLRGLATDAQEVVDLLDCLEGLLQSKRGVGVGGETRDWIVKQPIGKAVKHLQCSFRGDISLRGGSTTVESSVRRTNFCIICHHFCISN